MARVLVRQLTAGAVESWDEFLLPMMAGDNPMTAALAATLQQEGMLAELEPVGGHPYIPLPADWEEYRRRQTKKHRRCLSQALRDFADWAGTEQEVCRAGCVEELEGFKQTLIALHTLRWQQDGGVFRSADFLSFHDEIMAWAVARQSLELAVLRMRGEPIAAAYNIVWNGKVHYYQAGRRLDLPSSVRPGLALLAQLLQGHIAAGRRRVRFPPGRLPVQDAVRPGCPAHRPAASDPARSACVAAAAGREGSNCGPEFEYGVVAQANEPEASATENRSSVADASGSSLASLPPRTVQPPQCRLRLGR